MKTIKEWHAWCLTHAKAIKVNRGKLCGITNDYNTHKMALIK